MWMHADRVWCFALIASWLSVTGCWGDSPGFMPDDTFVPTEPAILSVGSPGADEDPSVLRGGRGLALPGYSPRVVATTTPGVYLGVWVAGPTGAQNVFYRLFALEP
jgi:hypothetical protein